MSRKREYANRIETAVRFPPETHDALRIAADEREVSMNFLVNHAVREYLDHLIPVGEVRWTSRCAVELGTHVGPYWLGNGTLVVCDRHKRQYETRGYPDETPMEWTPADRST